MDNQEVLQELKKAIRDYLDEHPRISLNGLSTRCSVSEPTLRRIMNGQVKTIPTLTTIVDILLTIDRANSVDQLIEIRGGALGEFLRQNFSVTTGQKCTYEISEKLNNYLQDEICYLIFKLAANRRGVTLKKVDELFGRYGQEKLELLLKNQLLKQTSEGLYHAQVEGFSLDQAQFVDHFKSVADFIKPTAPSCSRGERTNLYYNLSESVNAETMEEIRSIQRQALKKIAKLLNDPRNDGDIPAFVLSAIDSLELTPTQATENQKEVEDDGPQPPPLQ